MKIGNFGIGAYVTSQGTETCKDAPYEGVAIVCNLSGLRRLLDGLNELDTQTEGGTVSIPLCLRNGRYTYLEVMFDPRAQEGDEYR